MEAKAGKTMNLSRNYQKLISAAATLLGVVCIPQMLLSSGKGLDFSNSFLSVLLWGLSFPAADRALWKDKVLKGRTAWGFFGAFLFVMACCSEAGWKRRGMWILRTGACGCPFLFSLFSLDCSSGSFGYGWKGNVLFLSAGKSICMDFGRI